MTLEQQQLANNASIPAGQQGSPWTPPAIASPPSVTTVPGNFSYIQKGVSVNTLQQTPLSFPEKPPVSDPTAFVNSLPQADQKALSEYSALEEATQSSKQQGLEEERTGYLSSLKGLFSQLTGKSAAYQDAEKRYGVDDSIKKLQELNLMLAQRTGEYNKAIQKVEGKTIPIEFIAGQQAQLQRMQAVEIGALATQQQALQGNLQLAQQLAERTVKLQFEPIEQQIKNTLAFLEINESSLSREEKKQANKIRVVTEAKVRELEEQKALRIEFLKAGVTDQFVTVGGTVVRTSDGYKFSTVQEAAQAGVRFDAGGVAINAPNFTSNEAKTIERDILESDRNYQLAVERLNLDKKGNWTTTEDTNGNKVLLNTTTSQMVPISAPTGKKYSELYGAITGPDGSSYWKNGVDIDLKKGDPVYSPVSGTVIFSGTNGGFGNQVKIKDANGNEVWLSHLDANSVKEGQQVTAGMLVGVGGNTGNVIKGKGGDGSHLDMTVKTPKGFMTAREALAYADEQYSTASSGDLESRLKGSAGSDGKADPSTYLSERQKAKIGPDEFDKRYGYLLSAQEQKNLGIAGGVTEKVQFLNSNYFKSLFTPEQLAENAKESGYVTKRRLAPDKPDIDGYLKYLDSTVAQYRQAGYTDEEILKLMQE